jgi:hypothetical protein
VNARRTAAVAIATTLATAVTATPALAALDIAVNPNEEQLGAPHHVSGQFTDPATGAPLAGREISLQKRDFPFTGRFRTIGHATTDAQGRFRLDDVELRRNADLRAVSFDGTSSGIARAFTYPAFELTYTPAGTNKIKVTQVYKTPRDVRLKAPTLFYLGPGGAIESTKRVSAKTKRTAAGRFRATATIKLPKSWKGRFKYASCFRYSNNSGMGDPARGCGKRFVF